MTNDNINTAALDRLLKLPEADRYSVDYEPDRLIFITQDQKNSPHWTESAVRNLRESGPVIYPPAQEASVAVWDALMLRERIPILHAEPGQGKSGTIAKTCHLWLKTLDAQKLLLSDSAIFWITMINDNTVRDQGYTDYLGPSQMDSYVKSLHINNFYKPEIIDTIKQRTNFKNVRGEGQKAFKILLWLDENHQGLGKNGNLDRFCQEIGIDLRLPPNQWENQFVYVVGVTATGIPQDVTPLHQGQPVNQFVLLRKDSSYLSLQNLIDGGRLVDNAHISYKKNNYAYLLTALSEFVDKWAVCHGRSELDSGAWRDLWVLRVSSINEAANMSRVIAQECLRQSDNPLLTDITRAGYKQVKMSVFTHNSSRSKTVHGGPAMSGMPELSSYPINRFAPALLTRSPNRGPRIYFIIAAARAGKTIRNPYGIRWDDTCGKQTDTVVQSAGRAPGYGKDAEDYKIYCAKEEVERFIKWCDAIQRDDLEGVRNPRPFGMTGTHTHDRQFNLIPSGVRLIYTPTLSDMVDELVAQGYVLAAGNREVRHVMGFARQQTEFNQDFEKRLRGSLCQVTGIPAAYGWRNEEGMRTNPTIYSFSGWAGHFNSEMEQFYPALANEYRAKIAKLYATYGNGFYWYMPTAFEDSYSVSPKSILAA
jgi:hypothetical protein